MTTDNASLSSLPIELVLEVLDHLKIVRSYDEKSAFDPFSFENWTRQPENCILQQSLRSVCLTSRRLNRIATPILYESFTSSPTRHGIELLRLLHERLSASYISGSNCIKHLQYVEARISTELQKAAHFDPLEPDNANLAANYFRLLADIVKWAPNLQHLSVAVLEMGDVSFWKHVLPGQNTTAELVLMTAAGQCFEKLRTLNLQTYVGSSLESGAVSFQRICSVMSRAPFFCGLQAHGVKTCALPVQLWRPSTFYMLRRIELTNCMLPVQRVTQILSACKELRHVHCGWGSPDTGGGTLPDLYNSLFRHYETLKSLYLDLCHVSYLHNLDKFECFRTFRPLKCLETLTVSDNCYLGPSRLIGYNWTRSSPQPQMAELLPPSLSSFGILVSWNPEQSCCDGTDESPDLWDLVADCKSSGLNLKRIYVSGEFISEAPRLKEAFLEIGVHFQLN
jgi:hypothetical protein